MLGDQYRGQVVYSQTCAACHGATGEGGVGPKLQGNPISLAAAKAQIDGGGGTMPAQLVTGRQEEDVSWRTWRRYRGGPPALASLAR